MFTIFGGTILTTTEMNIDLENLTEALASTICYMMEFNREEYFAKATPTLFEALVDTAGEEKRHLKILVAPTTFDSLNEAGGYEVAKELKVSVSLALATEEGIREVQKSNR